MAKKDITSLRSTLEMLQKQNEIITVNSEVDPHLEMAGISKAMDNGPAIVFDNIKGYPDNRAVTALFSRFDRVAKIFDVDDPKKLKFKGLEAMKNPLPPKEVTSAPCQEVVITENIDVLNTLPVLKYTDGDAGRIIGGGVVLISGIDIGHCATYKRLHFRGKDWATLAFNPGSHFEYFVLERRKARQNLPLTINIGTSPAVGIVAGGGSIPQLVPNGSDELAIAGRLQGSPIEIIKAKTQDAWSLADAEWVIEGYVDTSQVVWENEAGETNPKDFQPFFPESNGHVGRARTTYKFIATAITRRKDNPIFYAPLAHSYEYLPMASMANEAAVFEVLNKQWPDLIVDVNHLPSMMGPLGMIIQLRKRRDRDERSIRDIMHLCFATSPSLRMVVLADDDVDIYDANDILWAMITRCDPGEAMIILPPSGSWSTNLVRPISPSTPKYRVGYDCTVPFASKVQFNRGEFAKVELEKWFSKEDIERVQAMQGEYAKVMAEKRV
jgi:gallate decarboxylase subunit C